MVSSPSWGSWVGPSPRITVADEDTAYGQVSVQSSAGYWPRAVGILLGPWTPPPGFSFASLHFTTQFEAQPGGENVQVDFSPADSGTGWISRSNYDLPSSGWGTITDPTWPGGLPSVVQAMYLSALADGVLLLRVFSTAVLPFKVSLLTLDDGATPFPLRQVQRDDGLGRSVMRARGTRSVQKSIRQRGYR